LASYRRSSGTELARLAGIARVGREAVLSGSVGGCRQLLALEKLARPRFKRIRPPTPSPIDLFPERKNTYAIMMYKVFAFLAVLALAAGSAFADMFTHPGVENLTADTFDSFIAKHPYVLVKVSGYPRTRQPDPQYSNAFG